MEKMATSKLEDGQMAKRLTTCCESNGEYVVGYVMESSDTQLFRMMTERYMKKSNILTLMVKIFDTNTVSRGAGTYGDKGTCPNHILEQSLKNVLILNIVPTKFKAKLILS